MEDFLYSYNQPKKFGKYDLFLDGKVTVNELVYKILTEEGEYQNIDIAEKVKEIESRLQTHFTFEHVSELPTEGKDTVIYLVPNAETSGDKDSYNEYMWDKKLEKFELIGSGTYAQQKAELEAESNRAKAAEKVLTDNLAQEVTNRTNADTTLNTKIDDTKTALQKEIDNRANELKSRLDTLDNQNLNTRITAIEDLNLSSVIELVKQLQSKITEIEITIEELKAYHPVEEPTEPEPETPTETTE